MCYGCCSLLQSTNVSVTSSYNILMIRTASSLFHLLSVRERMYNSFLCVIEVTNLRVAALITKLVNTVTRVGGLCSSFVQGSDGSV